MRKKIDKQKQEDIASIPVKKVKDRRTKMEKDVLKNFVFEKMSLGWTHRQIAEETGYTEQYIVILSREIREEYMTDMGASRDKHIAEQISRLEGGLKKVLRMLDKEERNAYVVQKLFAEYRATLEQIAKLRGLLVSKHEVVGDVADSLIDKFKIVTDNNDGQESSN